MKKQTQMWRLAARVLVLVMLVVGVPLPTLADEVSHAAPVPGLSASIAKAAAPAKTTLLQAQAQAQAPVKPAPDKSELGSTSFFKKPIGVAVLAVVGAGMGYMAYSFSHNRIHSVARQNQ